MEYDLSRQTGGWTGERPGRGAEEGSRTMDPAPGLSVWHALH